MFCISLTIRLQMIYSIPQNMYLVSLYPGNAVMKTEGHENLQLNKLSPHKRAGTKEFKRGIGSLFDPCVYFRVAAILTVTYGGKLLNFWIWRNHLAWSARVWFKSMRERQHTLNYNLLCGLICEKIQSHNYTHLHMWGQDGHHNRFPPLKFLGWHLKGQKKYTSGTSQFLLHGSIYF